MGRRRDRPGAPRRAWLIAPSDHPGALPPGLTRLDEPEDDDEDDDDD